MLSPENLQVEQLRHRLIGAERALATARVTSTAVGILMERHQLTSNQAFARLAETSQAHNVRVIDLAELLVHTGKEWPDSTDRHT